jgi:hypothetical protein
MTSLSTEVPIVTPSSSQSVNQQPISSIDKGLQFLHTAFTTSHSDSPSSIFSRSHTGSLASPVLTSNTSLNHTTTASTSVLSPTPLHQVINSPVVTVSSVTPTPLRSETESPFLVSKNTYNGSSSTGHLVSSTGNVLRIVCSYVLIKDWVF